MTTCRDIVQSALRKAKIIGLDDDAEAHEAQEGMDILQGIYDGFFASSEFGILNDVYVADDYTAKESERITLEGAHTVTLPAYVGEGTSRRAPYELSAIEIVGQSRNIWEQGSWMDIDSLDLDSAPPLLQFGKAGLSAYLAIELAGTFGGELSQSTVRSASRFIAAMRAKRVSLAPRGQADYY